MQTTSIKPAFETTDFDKIVRLNIWPYGNAKETKKSDGTYAWTCQHGTNECYGNMMLNCALKHFEYPANYNFLFCVDEYVQQSSNFDNAGASCASKLSLSMADV